MTWSRHSTSRKIVDSSLFAPLAAVLAAFLVARGVRWIDDRTNWSLLNFSPEGARLVLGALAPSLLTFIVFVFTFLLLAVQVAVGQLSPRIISRTFSRPSTRIALALFTFTYTYTLAALGRIETRVPQLP